MTRIQVSLGTETLALVDRYADAIGVPRSALCSILIAQGLMNYNPALLGNPGAPGTPPAPPEKGPTVDELLEEAKGRSEANG